MERKEVHVDEKTPWTVVCAIDFGTTYSGYCYSFKTDYDRNPLDVSQNPPWKNELGDTHKTPTCILFDNNQQFHSFGYEAEQKYASLAESAQEKKETGSEDDDSDDDDISSTDDDDKETVNEEHYDDWYFFSRFKMKLFKGESKHGISRKFLNMKLTAENGKPMSALVVFSEAIKYLKTHFKKLLDELTTTKAIEQREVSSEKRNLEDQTDDRNAACSEKDDSWSEDVLWIITVPAIWSDEAKQFMRKAGNRAGISDEHLVLALEPESAAIFCKHLSIQTDGSVLNVYQSGKQFMVVDCGDGTVDVTAYEVNPNMSLKELHCASGDALGGTNVDFLFFQFLEEIFGKKVLEKFQKNFPSDWLELCRSFEAKKRMDLDAKRKDNKVTFANCLGIFEEYEAENGKTVMTRIQEMGLKKQIKAFSKAKFRIEPEYLIERAFHKPVQDIVDHLQKLLNEAALKQIGTILLVGGFSDCLYLQSQIQTHFPDREVIIPRNANIAVMKGAVIFGHSQEIIVRKTLIETGFVSNNASEENIIRKSKKFYGIATNVPFVDGVHPEILRYFVDGKYVCTDVFKCMVEKNQELHFGRTVIEGLFCPASVEDHYANIEIYESEKLVQYCNDENCKRIAELLVSFDEIDDNIKEKRKFKVQMHFGFTEIIVTATDLFTGDKKSVNVNFT